MKEQTARSPAAMKRPAYLSFVVWRALINARASDPHCIAVKRIIPPDALVYAKWYVSIGFFRALRGIFVGKIGGNDQSALCGGLADEPGVNDTRDSIFVPNFQHAPSAF